MSNPFSLVQRGKGKIWWYRFTPPRGGKRVQESAGTSIKSIALEVATKRYKEFFDVDILGAKPKTSWKEAVVLWMNDKPERKEKIQYHIKWLHPHLKDMTLDQINKDLVVKLRDIKKSEGVSNRTVNAILQQIRGILKCAYEHDMLDKVPPIKLLPENKLRVRFLTAEEEARLLNELPDHLVPIVKFALSTGLRKSNIVNLTWDKVSFTNRMAIISADEVKTGETIGVPLNSDAVKTLKELVGKHPIYVFTYKGEMIQDPARKAWRHAVKRAGLGDFHFHDLRHTWASKHIMNGTSLNTLQRLGGWRKADTVNKYAHMSNQHLINEAERISGANLVHRVPNLQALNKR